MNDTNENLNLKATASANSSLFVPPYNYLIYIGAPVILAFLGISLAYLWFKVIKGGSNKVSEV